MGINLKSLKYMAQGFKKVALNDTKGVLTKKNNFKWVKEGPGNTMETIFPTGTRVREKSKDFYSSMIEDKIITKPDGTEIHKYGRSRDTRYITRYSNSGLETLARPVRGAKDAAQELTEKRLNFIDAFNARFARKTVKGEDGTVSKFIYDKDNGNMVKWWRKNPKGEVTQGKVLNLPGLGRTTTVKAPDGTFVCKSRYGVDGFGSEIQTLKIAPDNSNVYSERILKTKDGITRETTDLATDDKYGILDALLKAIKQINT